LRRSIGRFLHERKGSRSNTRLGLDLAIGGLWLHESGTYVEFAPAGAAD
jgi:hypothetical protein